MTYRLLLWFDMLEEEGKSTERVRGLFSRTPLLSKDLNIGDGFGSSFGFGFGNTVSGNGFGIGSCKISNGNGRANGDGIGNGWVKITVVKI